MDTGVREGKTPPARNDGSGVPWPAGVVCRARAPVRARKAYKPHPGSSELWSSPVLCVLTLSHLGISAISILLQQHGGSPLLADESAPRTRD